MAVDHRDRMRLIKEDAANDAMELDTMPFDGLSVGTMFGNVLASIAALADTVDHLLKQAAEEAPDDRHRG